MSISQAVAAEESLALKDSQLVIDGSVQSELKAVSDYKRRENSTKDEGKQLRILSTISDTTVRELDPANSTYVNTGTGEEISSDAIVTFNGNILETLVDTYSAPGYRLIPAAQVESSVGSVMSVNVPDYPASTGQDVFHRRDISRIICSRKIPDSVAGYVSQEIDVSDYVYIRLSVKQHEYIEYSIIDGKDETPILPVEQTYVTDEKIFLGLKTRFQPDETEEVIVKRNGIRTTYSFNDVQGLEILKDDLWTVSYKPLTAASKYTPKTNKIRVKLIQRCYPGSVPVDITDIKIRKYGRSTTWTLQEIPT